MDDMKGACERVYSFLERTIFAEVSRALFHSYDPLQIPSVSPDTEDQSIQD